MEKNEDKSSKSNKSPKQAKHSGTFMKTELICLFCFLVLFTIAILIIFVATGGSEPSTLIVSVFGLCGCECGILGWIKTAKEKRIEDEKSKKSDEKSHEEDTEEIE